MFFEFMYENATESQKWEQIRFWRNVELKNTDWTQLDDSPVNKTSWAIYRQALRDLPKQNVSPDEIRIPDRP